MARNTLLEFRRGTAAAWTAANPTLAAGEPGFETDTNKAKIGDGATAWNSLAYFGGGSTSPLTTKGDVWGYSTGDARIPVGSNGQVLTADSGQALGVKWASGIAGVAQLNILDSGSYTGGSFVVNTTTDATAQTVCSTAGISYDGSTNIILMAHVVAADTAAAVGSGLIFTIWEDSTDLGRFAVTRDPAATVMRVPIDIVSAKRTPSAASHTYTLKVFQTGGNGTVFGSTGGAGVNQATVLYVVQTN